MRKIESASKKRLFLSIITFLGVQLILFSAHSKVYYFEANDDRCFDIEDVLGTDKVVNMRGYYNGPRSECMEDPSIVLKEGDIKITARYNSNSSKMLVGFGFICTTSLVVDKAVLTESGNVELHRLTEEGDEGEIKHDEDFYWNGYKTCVRSFRNTMEKIKNEKVKAIFSEVDEKPKAANKRKSGKKR